MRSHRHLQWVVTEIASIRERRKPPQNQNQDVWWWNKSDGALKRKELLVASKER